MPKQCSRVPFLSYVCEQNICLGIAKLLQHEKKTSVTEAILFTRGNFGCHEIWLIIFVREIMWKTLGQLTR